MQLMWRITKMKRLFAALVLLLSICVPSFSQTDIISAQVGPYMTLGRNLAWDTNGGGGIQNAYIFTPLTPQSTVCVYMENQDSVSHTYTLQFLSAGDPGVQSFYNGAKSPFWKVVSTITDTVLATAVNNYSFSSPGTANAAVVITASS